MKRYIITVLLMLSYSFTNAQEWKVVSQSYTPGILQDIVFVNENLGWAVGNDGAITHTTDGGASWEIQNSGTDKDISKVFFLDENNGWAGTFTTGGTILKTTDGGKNWTEISYTSAVPNVSFAFFDVIRFVNKNVGFLIAGKTKSNYLLKTTDGGLTWVKKDSLISTPNGAALRWYAMDFYNENLGVVVGNAKNIEKYTTDGGETWNFSTAITDNFFKDLRGVKFISENEVVAVGDGQEINGVPTPVYKSFDGGANWVKKTQSPTNSYDRTRGLYFKNALEGIAVGNNGNSGPSQYKTTDGGETWTSSSPNTGFTINALSGNGDLLYALGSSSQVIKSTDFGVSWKVLPLKPSSQVVDIDIINNIGYAVQTDGTILKSTDANNEEWNYLTETGLHTGGSLAFLDENTGILLKKNRAILKTKDGGLTWSTVLTPVAPSTKNMVIGLSFGDNKTGYAWMTLNEYAEYHLFKSTDAGDTWNEIQNIAGPEYLTGDLHFFDADNGFIVGPHSYKKYTQDGGVTLNDAVVNMPQEYVNSDIEDISIDGNNAWCVGDGTILKSTDKGLTWNYVHCGLTLADSAFTTVEFYNDTLGFVTTDYGNIIKTTDGGNTWTEDSRYNNTAFKFHTSTFNDKGELYLGSSNGAIVKYKTTPTVGVEDDVIAVNCFKLDQNYPNPFNPSTTFSFSLAEQGAVSLKVYDVLGREAATVIDEVMTAGSHNIKFDASALSSGIYFYTLKSGKFSSTQKMVLIK